MAADCIPFQSSLYGSLRSSLEQIDRSSRCGNLEAPFCLPSLDSHARPTLGIPIIHLLRKQINPRLQDSAYAYTGSTLPADHPNKRASLSRTFLSVWVTMAEAKRALPPREAMPGTDDGSQPMSKDSKHVAPTPAGGWSVKTSGASRASRTFNTQAEAVRYGRSVAKKSQTELYVHGRDGSIKDKSSYRDSHTGKFSKTK